MVRIWSKPNTLPDIAGDLCATNPQCGDYCNHEEITAFVIPLRNQLYQTLNGVSAFLLLTVIFVILYVVSTDSVHRFPSGLGLLKDGIELKNQQTFAEVYLAQKKAQSDLEELERVKSLDDGDDKRGREKDEFDRSPQQAGISTPQLKPQTRPSARSRIQREYSIRRASRDSCGSDHLESARDAVANVVEANFGRVEYDTGKAQNLKSVVLHAALFFSSSPSSPPFPLTLSTG
jgi:hypothetical protein